MFAPTAHSLDSTGARPLSRVLLPLRTVAHRLSLIALAALSHPLSILRVFRVLLHIPGAHQIPNVLQLPLAVTIQLCYLQTAHSPDTTLAHYVPLHITGVIQITLACRQLIILAQMSFHNLQAAHL